MEFRRIGKEHEQALLLPNEPFDLFGRLVVERKDAKWIHKTELFDHVDSMVFPDEEYVFEEVDHLGFAIGAFDQDKCVGLAVYQYDWNRYVYLSDLKVNHAYRKQGIAAQLIFEGMAVARTMDYKGMSTVAQDNNLAACLFYLKQGFIIGGLNTQTYQHTKQKDKADIYFYLEDEN